ncbi:hypothetical protein C0993_006905 [Termitomyces sp. T159_Od127]|nr:hypothetical protein C0993_006905 [Termitomyces sp. T159_Od127]
MPPACCTTSSRSSPALYLNTPASSVTSSPQIAVPSNDHDRIRQILSITTTNPKDIPHKDTSRNKYLASLVDQAVKSLSEIWRPQDIPSVFVASAHTMVLGGSVCEGSLNLALDPKLSAAKQFCNTQLPSPISPSNRSSPAPSSPPSTNTSLSTLESDIAGASGSRTNLVPIKSFVHEVLRRSRTSGCVLQTALCYLEAIRAKVPELVRAEKTGEGIQGEVDRSDWITPATPEELEREREFMDSDIDTGNMVSDSSLAPTVRVDDISHNDNFSQSLEHLRADNIVTNHQKHSSASKLPPLPPLPSPLLCPRRAFLASLILASKFTQDKCYSNRAWAKLSGLPPREIGRCERALGEALDWRLWVGKQPSALSPSPPSQPSVHRPLMRVQSESCLHFENKGPFLVRHENANVVAGLSVNRGLRRHRTLPAEAFAFPSSIQVSLDQVPWRSSASSEMDVQDNDQMDLSGQVTPCMEKAYARCPSTSGPHHWNKIYQSPSPPTPSLTYSPSSTGSYSGTRTVQMSSFFDDSTITLKPGNTSGSELWPWLDKDNSDIGSCSSTIWNNRKISLAPGGPLDGTPSVDFTMTAMDGGSILYPSTSVLENGSSAYPSRW